MSKKEFKEIKVTELISGDFREIKNAKIVFEHAINSVNEFYKLFQANRRGSKGSTTHAEQDLLRAMLVFSCSGLDSVVKQLVKDSLSTVIDKEAGAQQEFQKFIDRRMKKGSSDEKEKLLIDTTWVASILASSSPRDYLIDALKKSLVDDSLQSRDQLLKVATNFAITPAEILKESEVTKKAFDVRNEIIHEMDASLGGQKKRRQRTAQDMVKYTRNILEIGSCFINSIHKKIYGST